jgi:hypothetical protein
MGLGTSSGSFQIHLQPRDPESASAEEEVFVVRLSIRSSYEARAAPITHGPWGQRFSRETTQSPW